MPDASKSPPLRKAARPKQQSAGARSTGGKQPQRSRDDEQQQQRTRPAEQDDDEEQEQSVEPLDPVQAALQRANRYKSEPMVAAPIDDDAADESEAVSGSGASLRVSPIRVSDSSGGHSVRPGGRRDTGSAQSAAESSLYDSDEDSEISPATVPRLVSDIRRLAGHQEPSEMRMHSARQSQSRVQSEKKKGHGTFGGALTGRGASLNTSGSSPVSSQA